MNPYVQQSVDLLKILPQLATGARCVVFTCIGQFHADPLGASKRDILDFTGLSRQTVESALRFLELSEYIEFDPDAKRYRCAKYYRYGGSESVDLRELVPILQGEARQTKQNFNNSVKNFSTSPSVVVGTDIPDSGFLETTTNNARAREIFATAGVCEPALSLLGSSVSAENAQAWADWIADAPASFTAPVAYAVKCLRADAEAVPPAVRRSKAQESVRDTLRKMREQGLLT